MKNLVKIAYVKDYPTDDERFILSVDATYNITGGKKEFWKSCRVLLKRWGLKITDYTFGTLQTPSGVSGVNLWFSTSYKAVLLAKYFMFANPEKEYLINMTEVAGNMYNDLFNVVKDNPNITLVTKVLLDTSVDEKYKFEINGNLIKSYNELREYCGEMKG